MRAEEILSRLEGVRGGDGQWYACCPAHDDHNQSLSVGVGGDGKILLHCHAGCSKDLIIEAMGLEMKDLFPEDTQLKQKGRTKKEVEAIYSYFDDDGKLLAQKIRHKVPKGERKDMCWRRPDGHGGWIYDRKGVPHRLYIAGEMTSVVYVVEGEKDADNLHNQIGGCAVSGANGAGGKSKWRKEYTEQLRGLSVVIIQDNDAVGKAFAQETAAALHGAAKSVKLLDLSTAWPDIPEHGDISDMIDALGAVEAARLLVNLVTSTPEWDPETAEEKKEVKRLEIISASDLQKADLPPIEFLVEGILPCGTSLLTAASKIGKSWMVLDVGLCVSAGLPFMGHQTKRCGVLYLALEDSYQRLQGRMNKILGGKPAPEQFYFSTKAPNLDNGLLDTLDDHLKQHPETKLIIIDTLQKIRGQALPREAAYAQDYREMGMIKEFLDSRGASSIFVHHNRKMKDDGDPFNMISGTNAIMGAADTVWTITKERDAEEATLHITGRDVEQSRTIIRFEKESGRWKPLGEADWLTEQRARLAYDSSPIVLTIKKLLEMSPEHRWSGKSKDLMNAGRFIAKTYIAPSETKLGRDIKALEKPLFEYDGIVHSDSRDGGNGGKKHHFYYQDLSQFDDIPDAAADEEADQQFMELPDDGSATPFDPARL